MSISSTESNCNDRLSVDVNRHIGVRLRERRIILGMTQQQLAKLLGITYQQVHKYETGQDCISARRLWSLAEELGVGMNYFFHEVGLKYSKVPVRQRALMELCRDVMKISNSTQRAAVCEMTQALSSAELVSSSVRMIEG